MSSIIPAPYRMGSDTGTQLVFPRSSFTLHAFLNLCRPAFATHGMDQAKFGDGPGGPRRTAQRPAALFAGLDRLS
jgi:hypothetical protein